MNTFQEQARKRHPNLSGLLFVGIDPGQTTGACTFRGDELIDAQQIPSGLMPTAAVAVWDYVLKASPDIIVVEDYRIYSWKAKDHTWNELHTPKLIGALEYASHVHKIPMAKQTAQTGKGFCTDDRLKEWGFYLPGKKHAMDAVRHTCHYIMFGAGVQK